jgi:hypothetical protein
MFLPPVVNSDVPLLNNPGSSVFLLLLHNLSQLLRKQTALNGYNLQKRVLLPDMAQLQFLPDYETGFILLFSL